MKELLKSILNIILPILLYVSIQSLISGLFITPVYQYLFQEKFNFHIGYFDWCGIVFIFQVIKFDLIGLVNSTAINNNNGQ